MNDTLPKPTPMKKICFCLFITFAAKISFAQTASEIYLFDLSIKKDKVSISNPVNITNHKGYDNQPSFHPDKTIIFYSSFNDDGRSDIRSYDYKTKQTKSITETTEKEYSPVVTLDKQYLSCIIQRDNGAQDLGKYPIEGGEPLVLIDNLTVGYHVWADNSHLGLFVLGTPNKLYYYTLPTKKDVIIEENIGRSLHKVPGESAMSFVHKVSDKEWLIKKLNTETMKVSNVAVTLTGKDDLCWLPDGKIMMSDGAKLFYLQPDKGQNWNVVEIESGEAVLKGASRLAVSANGKKVAIVVNE